MRKTGKNKVVLFFPSYASKEASPPLALISIAAPLIQAGFSVRIIDETVEPDPVQAVLGEMNDALCLGISVITGPMIGGAVRVGQAVKQRHPGAPIILGGWHPSILPEQTLLSSFVDVVALKQGEMTLLELARALQEEQSIEGVPGILWKKDGLPIWNAPRRHPPVAELPSRMPGYDLIDYQQYERSTGLRWVMYSSSHGCPYNCGYCSNASVYGRNLDVLPVDQVVDEVEYLVRRHGVKLLGIIDDIFFAFRRRSLQIAEGFLRRGLDFEWYIQDRVDCWGRLTPEEANLYRRSGLVRVHFGAESGSDEVLASIEKKANVERTMEALERCTEANIRASFGFIFGLPEEDFDDLLETVGLIQRIYENSRLADCYTNIFTPYPGSPLWPIALERGFQAPGSFEEWSEFYPRVTRLPWLTDQQYRGLQVIRQYLRFGYHQVNVGEKPYPIKHRIVQRALQPLSRFRVRRRWFGWPLEIYSYWGLERLRHGLAVPQRY